MIREIYTTMWMTDERIIHSFLFEDIQNDQRVNFSFWQKIHMIDNLKVNISIGINVIRLAPITVNISLMKFIPQNSNIEIPIKIKIQLRSI